MQNKRRLVGAAAGCAVAIATLLGTPAASAQFECVTCEPDQPPAFGKREAHGAPERAFGKINASEGAFLKIPHGAENPGGTENVFGKH